MSYHEFLEMVIEMRELQKKYFKTRDKMILAKSKEMEKKVDAAIEKLQDGLLLFCVCGVAE
jgi:hypothetical protein